MNRILYDQDRAEYFAAEGLNKSGIDKLLRSPAEYRYGPVTQATGSMNLGTVVHTLVLQPQTLADVCHVATMSARSRAGRLERDAALAAGKIRLTPGQFEQCGAAASAVDADSVCRRLLGLPGHPEVSLYWDMPLGSGHVPCKARLDYLAGLGDGTCIAVDLKTTSSRSVTPEGLPEHIHKWHYERQAAWYLAGLRALGFRCRQFVFLFVGMRAPHRTCAVRLTETAIGHGWSDCLEAAKLWQSCMATGVWPSSSGRGVESAFLPGWARSCVGEIVDPTRLPSLGPEWFPREVLRPQAAPLPDVPQPGKARRPQPARQPGQAGRPQPEEQPGKAARPQSVQRQQAARPWAVREARTTRRPPVALSQALPQPPEDLQPREAERPQQVAPPRPAQRPGTVPCLPRAGRPPSLLLSRPVDRPHPLPCPPMPPQPRLAEQPQVVLQPRPATGQLREAELPRKARRSRKAGTSRQSKTSHPLLARLGALVAWLRGTWSHVFGRTAGASHGAEKSGRSPR